MNYNEKLKYFTFLNSHSEKKASTQKSLQMQLLFEFFFALKAKFVFKIKS